MTEAKMDSTEMEATRIWNFAEDEEVPDVTLSVSSTSANIGSASATITLEYDTHFSNAENIKQA